MKKSQAALEFLTTYSWAFLVIIIMVGALAYFGVLSPSKLLPDRCNFGSEVTCNKDSMVVRNVATGVSAIDDDTSEAGNSGAYTVNMRLKNSVGVPIRVTDATATTDTMGAGSCFALLDKDGSGDGFNMVDPGAGGTSTSESGTTADNNYVTWMSDETLSFLVRCTGTTLVAKEKVKFIIEINYYSAAAGSTYNKKVIGEVFSTIQA